MNNNCPPLTFKRFQTIVSRLELPRRPLPTLSLHHLNQCGTKMAAHHQQLYSIPSLEELGRSAAAAALGRSRSDPASLVPAGFRTEGLAPAVWRGGESEALERLHKHLDKKVEAPAPVRGRGRPLAHLCPAVAAGVGGPPGAGPGQHLLAVRQPGGPQPVPALRLPVLPRPVLQPAGALREGSGGVAPLTRCHVTPS